MRFDPSRWQEVVIGELIPVPSCSIRLNTSQECAVYVRTAETSGDVLVGVGTTFDVDLIGASDVEFYVDGPESARAFLHWEATSARPSRAGVFTNPDRANMGMASDAMAAVSQALRQFRLEQGARDREAAAALRAVIAKQKPQPAQSAPAPAADEPQAAAE